MTRSLAAVVTVAALAAPAQASAASLNVVPEKRCYSAGESVNLIGAAFTPTTNPAAPMSVNISRDGTLLGALVTDANGAFNGVLTLAQPTGRKTKTYRAVDATDQTLTASDQITVSAVRVGLRPSNGAPGRVMSITARGFTTGRTLWAHVIKGKSRRHIELGRLKGACGGLETRRRLLPRNASLGVHTIQFDTFRRYKRSRPVRDRSTITVTGG
jgi:hypothetical protein